MLFGDLINTVKQRAAGRTEEERKSHKELLDTPEFIFEETLHQAKHELRLMVRVRTHTRTLSTLHSSLFDRRYLKSQVYVCTDLLQVTFM